MLWLRTAVFTILVPGTVLFLIPFSLVRLGIGPRFDLSFARYLGLVPLLAGVAAILWCFADFIRRGRGTPAPYDPPRELVIAGLYRYVRNPQYVGVLVAVVGETLLTGAAVLLAYTALLGVGYHLFVTLYEEPALSRLFGDAYGRYRAAVPRWIPRRPRGEEGEGVKASRVRG
jgi:protein-S-isoprenylcysteine O-methyltransferase Ste14